MLALFNCLSLSGSLKEGPMRDKRATFDLQYVTDSGEAKYITYDGFWILVDIKGVERNGRYILRSDHAGIHKETGWQIKYWRTNRDDTSGKVFKYAMSINTWLKTPVTANFGLYARFTNTNLSFTRHNSAVQTRNQNGIKSMIIMKDDHQDPDTIFMGPFTHSNFWGYPFMRNSTEEVGDYAESGCGFSYSLTVKSEPTIFYFEIAADEEYNTPPIIKFIPPNENNKYEPNFDLSLDVLSYNDGEIEISKRECEVLTEAPQDFVATPDEFRKTIKIPGHYDESVREIPQCRITATNKNNHLSKTITVPINNRNIEAPRLNFNSITPDNNAGQEVGVTFLIDLTVNDDYKVDIWYKWELDGQGQDIKYREVVTAPSGTKTEQFSFPTTGLKAGTYTLRICAVDPLKQWNNISFNVPLKMPEAPKLTNLYTSYKRVLPGQQIVIFGDGSDSNDNTNVVIHALWNDQNAADSTELGGFMPGNTTKTFAYYYTIPKGADVGDKKIYLKAVGKEGSTRIFSVDVIVKSATPLPKDIAKISDTSDSLESTKSCFNLKYTQKGQEAKTMSHRDEGFYVAYRLYVNDLYPNETTHYVTKSHDYTDTTDSITVKYSHTTAPVSEYFQAKFTVSNSGSFDQSIDLGLFVDSDFGGDQQRIELREDGTGIIVSDDKAGVYYTVLSQYDGSPAFTNFDLAPSVKRRSESAELEYNEMPFFGQSGYGVRKYYGKDPMYTLSWLKQSIKAGTTVNFTLTFVGYDDIRTPSVIVKKFKQLSSRYDPDTTINAQFEVIDNNIGETLNWELTTQPNNQRYNGHFEVGKQPNLITQALELGKGPIFEYTLVVTDTAAELSTTLTERLHVSAPFDVTFDNLQKTDYFPGNLITFTGSISGYDQPVIIKYQFGENNQVRSFKGGPGTFVQTISIPEELTPSTLSYKILLWAETENGLANNNGKKALTFFYTVRDPPILRTAGLAVKRAYPGQEVIGFAAVNDTQYGRTIEVLVKFGRDAQYEHLPNNNGILRYFSAIKNPFPFLYRIPNHAQVGKVYQVWFKAIDPSGLESEPKMQTVVIRPAPI